MKLEFSWQVLENTQISDLIKISPVETELFDADRRTDGRTDRNDAVNSLFAITQTRVKRKADLLVSSQSCEKWLLASSQCLSVRPSAWNSSASTGRILMKLYIWAFFENKSNLSFIKIRQEWRVLYMKTFSYLWQYLAQFFLQWEMFQIKAVQKINIHILHPITFFRKSCRLWDNV